MTTNNDRIRWAERALVPYMRSNGHGNKPLDKHIQEDVETCASDLIADVLHLARSRGFDVELMLRRAKSNFDYESAFANNDTETI